MLNTFGKLAHKLVTQIHEHPTMRVVQEFTTHMAQTLGIDRSLFETQPFDIRPNTSLASHLLMRVKFHAQEASAVKNLNVASLYEWLLHLYDVMDIEISRKFQGLFESYVYERADKMQGKNKRSVAQISYAYFKHTIDKRDLDHEVVALLYPLFKVRKYFAMSKGLIIS